MEAVELKVELVVIVCRWFVLHMLEDARAKLWTLNPVRG